MAQEFNSPFSPFGAPKPEEELLYPEQGMQFGNTGNSQSGTESLIASFEESLLRGQNGPSLFGDRAIADGRAFANSVRGVQPQNSLQFGGTGNSLFGTQPTDGGVDPTVLAGLGLGGGIVAAGTGGQAATSQVLSPFAQRVAAQDAARLAAQNRPLLVGGPTTTQGVLVGSTPAQYTGTAQGRPVSGTQLTAQGQPPAVRSTSGAPAVRGTSGPPMKIAEKVDTAGSGSAGRSRIPGASTISKLLSTGTSFLFPEPLDDSTVSGAYDRLMEAGDVERAEALGYTDPFTEMANAAYQEMLDRKDVPQMSRLSDEPLTFTAPTGPSSATQRAAELAATLPDDSGLMGAPGVQGTGIPTTTLDIDGGSVTVPQALADQTFQGIGAAPMSIEETRARLGGRTLNEYLNAPSGTEGVSGLRTDPQGRMIPAGFETRADAYGNYERESAAREGRLAARMQQPGESITERDTRNAAARTQSSQNVPTDVREAMLTPEGRRTAKQINRLARWSGSTQGQEMGGVAGLEQSLQPVDAQQQQYDAMRIQKLGLELDRLQQEEPDKYTAAESEVDGLITAGIITPDKRRDAILSRMGYDPEELLGVEGFDNGGNVFNTVEEAEAANLPPGTQVTIGGKKAIIE